MVKKSVRDYFRARVYKYLDSPPLEDINDKLESHREVCVTH